MRKTTRGFTIVELLIVIVVIAILAAVSIIAYTGVQQRARNSQRVSDVVTIQKALEMFRAEYGRYPYSHGANSPASAADLPAGTTIEYGPGGYGYSNATNGSWLKELRDSGLMKNVPVAPGNDSKSYYVYFSFPSFGSCPEPGYALIVQGWEGGTATMPTSPRAQTLNCSITGVVTGGWIQTSTRAVFSNLDHPNGT